MGGFLFADLRRNKMTDVIEAAADAAKTVTDVTNQEGQKVYTEEYVNTVKASDIARGKQIKELETKLKKFEDEKLTDSEKKEKRIAELEAEKASILSGQKDKDIDNLILKKSNGKNVIDIDALMMFAKKELATIEDVDDKAVESVVNKILKEKSYLISTSNIAPSPGNFKKQDNEVSKKPLEMLNAFITGKTDKLS